MRLAPELESPKARVDRRVIALAIASAAALAGGSWIAMRSPAPPAVVTTVPMLLPPVVTKPAPAPDPMPDPGLPAPSPIAQSGVCAVTLPAGYREPTTGADAKELVDLVNAWAADPQAEPPAIEYRRGIAYVESAEDRGDDGPYPKSAGPEAQRVCGSASIWLRDHIRAQLAWRGENELTCDGNICCYPGMEYAPEGVLVFHRIKSDAGARWVLTTWMQEYTAGLTEEYATANDRFAMRSLIRLAGGRCVGEPDGAY